LIDVSRRGGQSLAKVFVFGTLKTGFPLHEVGLGDAVPIGAYRTVECYPMLVAGQCYAPMMLHEPGRGLRVRGELYEIDRVRLRSLDAIESVGTPGNLRIMIDIEPLNGGPRVSAYAYMKSADLAVPAHTGWLDDYQDRRFIPPWSRT
jgi:gamma-glutamylaminecyclotransferase